MNRRAMVLCIGIAMTTTIGAARAETNDDRAYRQYQRALRLYDLGDYPEAIDAFRRGYLFNPRRSFLYNMGRVRRLLGDREMVLRNPLGALREYSISLTAFEHLRELHPKAPYIGDAERQIAGVKESMAKASEQLPPLRTETPPSAPAKPPPAATVTSITETAGDPDAARVIDRNIGLGFIGGGFVSLALSIPCFVESAQVNERLNSFLDSRNPEWRTLSQRKGIFDGLGPGLIAAGIASAGIGFYFLVRPAPRATVRTIYITPAASGAALGGRF